LVIFESENLNVKTSKKCVIVRQQGTFKC